MKRIFIHIFALFAFSTSSLNAQDTSNARKLIYEFSADSVAGRGYVTAPILNNNTAGIFLAQDRIIKHLISYGYSYQSNNGYSFQNFPQIVNTFPGKQRLLLRNGIYLKTGIDWVAIPESGNSKGNKKYKLIFPDSIQVDNIIKGKPWAALNKINALVLNSNAYNKIAGSASYTNLVNSGIGAIILPQSKPLLWSVSNTQLNIPIVEMRDSAALSLYKYVHLQVNAQKIKISPNNIILNITGTSVPDSFIYLTAHYDHLGMFGKEALYAGANDNAGGIAMLLQLANYFKQHPPKYSVCLIWFAGEEAGLLGSKYYVDNPTHPLNSIKLLLNLDLVTNGQDGATVVNANVFPNAYQKIEQINNQKQYFVKMYKRGSAANSDHYWFGLAGVPALFMYLGGNYPYYHHPNDTANRPTLIAWTNTVNFIIEIVEKW